MVLRRPEIFVSATTADLRSGRQLVKEALLTLGCTPVEQTNFPPDYRSVEEMLRARIAACDAIIHLAGRCYGAEPQRIPESHPRRSYTQLEYHLALELDKPRYVFVCGEGFPYDEHEPEDTTKRELQQRHREALIKGDQLYTEVPSREDLALRVRELQTVVDQLTGELQSTRSRLRQGVTAALVILVLLSGALWFVRQKGRHSEQRLSQVEKELDRYRQAVKAVAERYNEGAASQLSDEQKFDRALAAVAEREKVPVTELKTWLEVFVAQVRGNAGADFYDRALADFAEKRFSESAVNATKSADLYRSRRLAAEQEAAAAAKRAESARQMERNSLKLAGDAFVAAANFSEATTAFLQALELCKRPDEDQLWAAFENDLGVCYWGQGIRGRGEASVRALQSAVTAYRESLKVRTRERFSQDWAATQNNLGSVFRDQAIRSEGAEAERLLGEAVAAYRDALKVRPRQRSPQGWAAAQNNLGIVLMDQAMCSDEPAASDLLAQSVAAYRAALEVYTRESFAEDWAMTQNNLGFALNEQADRSDEPSTVRLLNEAVAAYRNALQVRTRERFPEAWAMTQNNLGTTLSSLADRSEKQTSLQLLDQAMAAYREALKVRTREKLPQDWAVTQHNIATALRDLAVRTEGPAATRLLAEAVAAYREALKERTRDQFPQDWAMTQNTLGNALSDQAERSQGADAVRLFGEAITAYREALTVYTKDHFPRDYAGVSRNLEFAEAQLRRLQ